MPGRYLPIYKKILLLGFPILIGQLGNILSAFADTIMVGHYTTDALASASFVNNMFNMAMFTVMGFTYGLTPLVGALFVKGREMTIGRMVRSAMWINIIVALIVTAIMGVFYINLDRMGQPAHLLPVIRPYYLLYLAGMVPVTVFNVFAQWSYAINRTLLPTVILIGANLLNFVGNYALIFGHFGLPEAGLTGAGIATLVARVLSAVAIMAVFFGARRFRGYREGFTSGKVEGYTNREIVTTSWPVALQMALESGSFTMAAVMSGWVGAIGLASFQVVVITGMLGFMIYYSFGTSVAILVSNANGRGDREAMKRVAFGGYHIELTLATVSSLIFVFFARYIMAMFTDDPAVYNAALLLVVPLVMYQYGDATQINFANALRGTANVMPMLWIAFVSYVAVGFPVMYGLAFPLGLGVIGIVLSWSISLFLAAGLFLRYFLKTIKNN